MIELYIGSLDNPIYHLPATQIYSAKHTNNVALVGQELSVDSYTFEVMDSLDNVQSIYHFRSSDHYEIELADSSIFVIDISDELAVSGLIALPYGKPIWYYADGELRARCYLTKVTRTGRNRYKISAVSAIGKLDKMEHAGGLFEATTFGAVAENILKGPLEDTV